MAAAHDPVKAESNQQPCDREVHVIERHNDLNQRGGENEHSNRGYRVTDYENGKDLGTVQGPVATV
jgi:hypothetical protein